MPTSAHAGPPGTGGKIAFASTESGNYEIWVMNADGSNRTVLTSDPAIDQDPDWSPNGKPIAFARVDDGVYTMNADGSGPKRISAGRAPAWSPDGTRIALEAVGAATGTRDIFVVNADGSNLTNLTNTQDMDETHPTWSPDGRKIAFEKNGHATWTMNADGSNRTYLGVGWTQRGRPMARGSRSPPRTTAAGTSGL